MIVEQKKHGGMSWWQPALQFFAQITGWIALPIVAAIYLGRYLDARYGTAPYAFYVCVAVAFVITNVGLFINVRKAAKNIEKN